MLQYVKMSWIIVYLKNQLIRGRGKLVRLQYLRLVSNRQPKLLVLFTPIRVPHNYA
jgi:hypothetical protein